MDARYWETLPGSALGCTLCHRHCVLAPGASGACRVRRNEDGLMALPFAGAVSATAVDPIEKKPLYHFLPGSSVFSVGYLGCNLFCPFCQNYHISQSTDMPVLKVSPAALAAQAYASGCPSIAHTYSEPLVHAEFVSECMDASHELGLANILVTNGHAGVQASRAVLENCDAVNVDIKTWDTQRYHSMLGGNLEMVRAFIELALDRGVHVEVTTLVVPALCDEPWQIEGIADYLASLSPDIAYHLSAYRPMYRYQKPATSLKLLASLATAAKSRLRFVYTWPECGDNDTHCPSCGSILVARDGWTVDTRGIRGDVCTSCGAVSAVKTHPGSRH